MLTDAKIKSLKEAFADKDFESLSSGIAYLCSLKPSLGLTWDEIAEASAEIFGTTYKEGYFRRNYGDALRI